MKIEKNTKKQFSEKYSTNVKDQILAVYEFTNRVLAEGRFIAKDPDFNKNAYKNIKKSLFITTDALEIDIPNDLISSIKKVDEIAVKEYKKEFRGCLYPGIFIICIGVGMYFLIGSLVWPISCIMIAISYIFYGYEQLSRANELTNLSQKK
ncbi:hypothetical protein [Flavobacterium johnsoniae]|uniref:hypothetical protein n=1 Tax=Flavobacterium johnsoniae TaxID=986 RepID=UPI0011EC5656|nr:hypothetical protein [Flavobacterium johnsoniae]